jgi:polyphosphate glucokinase
MSPKKSADRPEPEVEDLGEPVADEPEPSAPSEDETVADAPSGSDPDTAGAPEEGVPAVDAPEAGAPEDAPQAGEPSEDDQDGDPTPDDDLSEDDQDKAGAFTGEQIDPGDRRIAIGVDVGGSGIKAAAVDLETGALVGPRHRVPTPQPSAPAAVIASISRLVRKISREVVLAPDTPVGVGFPSVVIDGVTKSAANVDPGWMDFDADGALERVLGRPVHLVNDADAAGVAEMRFGAGVGQRGTVFLITLGTGTGSALFYNGMLVPNLELGHMEIRGRDAERRSAAVARIRRGISWKAWASDLDEHLLAIEKLFSPRMFIIGGGVSKRSDRFIPRLTVRAAVVPATLLNDAGIVGAAMAAAEQEAARTA